MDEDGAEALGNARARDRVLDLPRDLGRAPAPGFDGKGLRLRAHDADTLIHMAAWSP